MSPSSPSGPAKPIQGETQPLVHAAVARTNPALRAATITHLCAKAGSARHGRRHHRIHLPRRGTLRRASPPRCHALAEV